MQFPISTLTMAILAFRTQAAAISSRQLDASSISICAAPNCQKHLLFLDPSLGCQELPSVASMQVNIPNDCTFEFFTESGCSGTGHTAENGECLPGDYPSLLVSCA